MRPLGRQSGILLPLFSLRSKSDFGIGDFGALPGVFDWMVAARQRLLMLLPLLPTAPGDPSPYATRSAFGLNPLFIDLEQVPEFLAQGGVSSLGDEDRRHLDEARAASSIRYDVVFGLKARALQRAFGIFDAEHPGEDSGRGGAFARWCEQERAWLDDYALFAALSEDHQHRAFWEWSEPLATRQPAALGEARARLAREVRFRAWLQWQAHLQWDAVRKQAAARHLVLCGDEPFIIGQDSADTWANPTLLRRDARLGVPPDAFSASGQDWGLPYFDFQQMAKDDYAWLRFRAKQAASYYDVRRVDHAVGYFRQYIRDAQTPEGRFLPEPEDEQRALGEHHFRLLSADAGIVAEDLGVIPAWVRETLTRLGLPGYRVLRWEKDAGHPRDPHAFPALSLVTTGTHDTSTLREWWEDCQPHERHAMGGVYAELRGVELDRGFTPEVHRALLAAAINAGSDLCVLPWQDVLGTRERVNLPGSTGDANWSYRIAQPVDELLTRPETRQAAAALAQLCEAGRR